MEKYQLIFNGERCGDYAKLPIEHHVKLLKISERARQTILLGKRIAIKSGVPRKEVQDQTFALEKLGLVTEPRLQLNANIFAAGLRRVETSLSEIDLSLPVYELDNQLKPPFFVGRPYDDIVKTSDQGDTVAIETSSYQLNGFLLIAMAAFLGLTMQVYIVVLAKSLGFANLIASLSGIIFLLACVVTLPRLFQPLQKLQVQLSNGRIDVYEQTELIPGKKRFLWETQKSLGEFSISAGLAEASSVKTLYYWSALHSITDTSETAVEDIQSLITEGTVIETVQTLYEKIRPILLHMVPNFSGKVKIKWESKPASVVTNSEGEIAALIYQNNEAAYRIVRKELCQDAVLHAFCLSIHTAGLI